MPQASLLSLLPRGFFPGGPEEAEDDKGFDQEPDGEDKNGYSGDHQGDTSLLPEIYQFQDHGGKGNRQHKPHRDGEVD